MKIVNIFLAISFNITYVLFGEKEIYFCYSSLKACITIQKFLFSGAQRDWFIEQINADVEFLHTLGVQDYSLLLGRHPIYTGDKKESVHNLVIRMKK